MKERLCLYHKSCQDGFVSALVYRKKLIETGMKLDDPKLLDTCEFIPVQYGEPAPDVYRKRVVVLDFSFKRDVLEEMNKQAESLLVLDHHSTAEKELAGLNYAKFRNDWSGAMMTWWEFFGQYEPDPSPPLLVQYAQDRDLWSWKLRGSKEISAALASYPHDFSLWENWLEDSAPDENALLDDLIVQGNAILRYQQQCIEKAVNGKIELVKIGGYVVPCANNTHLLSEITGELAIGHPFASSYFDIAATEKEPAKRVFSLRSEPNGMDVSEIAKKFGGGGHKNAAGFSIPRPPII